MVAGDQIPKGYPGERFKLSRPIETPFLSAPGPDNAGRVLIVDDLEDNRAVLGRRLRNRGFDVVYAQCGEEALCCVRKQEFDAVLLDVMMPGLDGNETLSKIREEFSAAALPVIMVTAKARTDDMVESLTRGANDYVTKPIDFSIALARINNQVSMRRARSELERSQQKIAFLAQHDLLTALPNRYTFDQRLQALLEQTAERGTELSLLFVDLDGFKHINDTLGHTVGDELLKIVAQKICCVLGPDEFCARLGGDEFAVIHLSEDGRISARALAQNLIAAVGGGHNIAGRQIFVEASIGVATTRRGEQDAATLLRHADLALYRAKNDGRGAFRFFEAEMAERAESRRAMEMDLRRAVARGEFRLLYQPVVDVRRGRVVGAEALLRWHDPERGMVSPADFIPVAEDTGLILPLGELALRQACADAAKWPGRQRVAVNLSPIQFRDPNLLSIVLSALDGARLAPERLELEITESVVLDNSVNNIRLLNELRGMGVRISLDDFGTGYSGLGYFRAFRFDRVKIDQAFIRDLLDQPTSLAIVRAAISLCGDMNMSITAEGVETEQQLDVLRGLGCHAIQGYLFSKPLPQNELAAAFHAIERRIAPSSVELPLAEAAA
jgi:diguanylate cyclase (GGDEF)-like protein